jgi:hypothetical protein
LRRKNSGSAIAGSIARVSKSVSVSSLAPTWQMIAVRRRQRSPSFAQSSIIGVTRARSARRIGPIRRIASSSTWSHHAPLTIISSYTGTSSASCHRRYARYPERSMAA